MTSDQPQPAKRLPRWIGQSRGQWRRRLLAIALTIVSVLAAPTAASIAKRGSGDAHEIAAMGITMVDECERTRTGCEGGGGGGGGGQPVGGCSPQLTQQSTSRGNNPEFGGPYTRVTIGTKLACSPGLSLPSVRVRTELWDRTHRQRVAVLVAATETTSINVESSIAIDLYDIDYYPAAQRVEIVQLAELDAGPGHIWQCNDTGAFSFLWCFGENTRYLSGVVGFHPFSTNLGNPQVNYVALGDSFSSGSGAGTYDVGGKIACLRSAYAYSRVVVRSNTSHLNMGRERAWGSPGMRACHGAIINDVPQQMQDDSRCAGCWEEVLNTNVKLVTLSISGNDAGFEQKLQQCIHQDCSGSPLVTTNQLLEIQSRLLPLYRSIRSKMSPNGKLVILNYPKIFPPPNALVDPIRCPIIAQKITIPELSRIDEAWNLVNLMIFGAVQAVNDPNVVLLDVSDAFRGHDMCAQSPWANGVTVAFDVLTGDQVIPLHVQESFHPNKNGHAQMGFMLQQLLREIGTLP